MSSENTAARTRLAFIGFGEAGRIIGDGLVRSGRFDVAAYDILLDDPSRRQAMADSMTSRGVAVADSAARAVSDAALVISAVTARSAGDVARAVAPHIAPGAIFMDINSVSPAAKQANAAVIEKRGAHYVDAGVMESVPPKGIKVPMLLGGAKAADARRILEPAGMDLDIVSADIGVASAIKMCRSVMIKGLEALTIECLLTARRYGVEDRVIASLDKTFPSLDWNRQGDYLMSRVVLHGQRRAAEMREAAVTVAEAGLEPWMVRGTVERQQWVADLAARGVFRRPEGEAFRWRGGADAVLEHQNASAHPAKEGV